MKKFTLVFALFFFALNISANDIFDQLYVVGDGSDAGWDPESAIEMEKVGEGVFTWTGTLYENSGDQERFKFLTHRDWDPSVTCRIHIDGHLLVEKGGEYDLYVREHGGDQYDNAFQVPSTGTYSITVDLNKMIMTIDDDTNTSIVGRYKEEAPFVIFSADNTITFKMNGSIRADNIEIYDIAGNLIKRESDVVSFSTSNMLDRGIYVLRVRYNNNFYSSKILVN
ncbi:SusF/SusE family outer membrane protein [Marinilabiliaceae bacterium ANBcel2]|nr:SusF/SusE family outer membrane protein [Marinilabiliaceae bacterium ANBcel2]